MIRLPLAVLVLTAGLAFGQKDGAVPKDPILCLEPGGPTAAVTCLAFAKDRTGDVLYSAGIDKVIRVWRPAPAGGFTLRPEDGLRIPIGPGLAGSINRMAVTPDGEFLAVTGNGVIPGMAGFGKGGEQVIGQGLLSKEQRRDLYAVYVFSPARRTVTVLRGPEELVQNLAFAVADGKAVLVAQGPRFGPAEEKVMTGRGYAWDVELADGRPRGKLRADWEEPNLPFHEARPGLAVRLTATGTLLAAAAWGDGTFRVREVDPTGQTRRSAPESSTGRAQFTLPVAAIPGGWLTGGGLAGKGYVQAWSEDRPPTAKWSVDLPPPESVPYLLPTDFGLIAGGEKLDHVAAIVRYPEKRYALALLSFAEVKVTALIRDALFPEQRVSPPAFACSPDGRWVAVAGRGDKEIRVLAAADLVKGAVPGDTLKSAGTDFAAAAFVRGPKGIGRGLLLSTRPKAAGQAPVPDKTDLVLDFNTRKLEPAGDAGWTAYEPAAAGWTATLTGKTVVTWTGPGGTQREVQLPLPQGHEVTDVAICPPAAGGVAVLAVASWKASTQEPLLQLFELPGGARVRLLAGHTRAIRSLAASADGQFLASVADDQTTCVWDLRDLNATVGKLADVGGVRFVERDKRLVVETVEDQQKMFEPGDVLAAVTVMAGALPKEVPLTSAADYKAAVWPRAPGDKLTFAVVRKNERRTVQVTLEQMADERKPFLTVFANAPERQWVAWTPAGTFDAAGRDAERYIGWQFNPPQLDGPVQFAFVEQYRDKLRDGGLLKTLAGVPDRISRLPRPDLVVSHQGRPILDIADGGAPLLVAEAKLKLNVAVPNLSIPDGQLAALIWSVGGPPNDLLGAAGPDRVADITLPGRGDHRITFRARTREADPQDVTYDVLVRFHPPAPTLKLIRPQPGRVTVHEPEAVVEFDAVPAEGQKADIQVLQNGRPVKIEAGAKKVGITLAEGENVLSVVASNGGVPDDFRERETARATAVLVYQPPAAPDVVLTDLLPKGATGPVKLVPGQPTVIATSEVELGGRITAPEPLTSLTVNGAPVPGFVADKVKETDLKVKVELKPGTNTITVVSATKNARPTTARLTVSYRPPLPVVEIQTPAQNDEIDGTATDRVEFRAVATPSPNVPADHARRFELLIRVMHQGKPVPQGTETEVVIPGAEKPMTVRRPLTLRPGPNLIAVRVRSTVDGTTETLGERRVTVLRKPAIETAAHSPPNRQRKTDLTLTVRSADKVTEVLVNGRTRPFNTEPRAAGGYSVKVVDVQLEPGSNRLAVVVANADGRSAETAMTVAAADPARDERRRAQVEVLVPQATLEEPETPIRFVVNSHEPVAEVRLVGPAAAIPAWKPDPAAVEERVGVLVTEGAFPAVRLATGVNDLRLVVRTADGVEVEQPFRVTYLPRPVTLTIDRPGRPVPEADFIVRGTVRWANPAAADRDRVMKMAVHVNGYRQPVPAEVAPAENGFTFRLPVRLRQEDNLVTVELTGTPTEAASRTEFTVSCARPQADPQTLHLLVVAVGQEFEGKGEFLATQALNALHARAAEGGFQSRVFSKVIVHPLRPRAAPSAVAGHVAQNLVNVRLKTIQSQSGPHDVTLVYWIGRERVEKGERYLLTSEAFDQKGLDLRRSAIPLKDLVGDAGRGGKAGAGARVVLLDTVADGPAEAADDRAGRAAVLRYAWSRAESPVPGLLTALEQASKGSPRTLVETLARVADRRAGEFPTRPVLEHNLDTRDGAGLGRLILTSLP